MIFELWHLEAQFKTQFQIFKVFIQWSRIRWNEKRDVQKLMLELNSRQYSVIASCGTFHLVISYFSLGQRNSGHGNSCASKIKGSRPMQR